MRISNLITDDVLISNGFNKHWSYDMPNCDWYIWLNNSRLLTINKGKAIQYKVKQFGRRDCFNMECTETKFIKTKIVKDLIHKGILIEK